MNEQRNMRGEGPEEGAPQPVSNATGRIEVIIEAAEKAAAGIIEDAEAQARRYLSESRRRADQITEERARAIADATDALIDRAETLKRHSDDLIRALEDARLQIGAGGRHEAPGKLTAAEPPAEPSPQAAPRSVSHLKPVAAPPPAEEDPASEAARARPAQEPYAERRRPPSGIPTAGARLLATQMAVAGSSRAEIERRLRSEFGVEDAEGMLNGILGPES